MMGDLLKTDIAHSSSLPILEVSDRHFRIVFLNKKRNRVSSIVLW